MSSSLSQGLSRVDLGGIQGSGVAIEIHQLIRLSSKNASLLHNVSFYLPAHSLVAVAGASGAGVSAVLETLAGVTPPTAGQVTIDGASLYEYRRAFIPNIGYVSAQATLLPGQTPGEALRTAAALRLPRGTDAAARNAQVEAILSSAGLSAEKNQPIASLSPAERFRTRIAAEAVARPFLLLVDVPGEAISPGAELALVELYRGLTRQGITVLFAATSARAMALADLLLILDWDGSLVWFGPPEEALPYFDRLRNQEPRIPPQPGLDDLFSILESPNHTSNADWAGWFQTSPAFSKYVDGPTHRKNRELSLDERPLSRLREKSAAGQPPARVPRSTGLQQYFIFLSRNFKLLARDPIGLVFAFLAPIFLGIGILLTVSPGLYDPVRGDAAQIDLILGLLVFLTLFIASFGRIQDAVRDRPAYRRERELDAGILPYVLAKLSLVVPVAIYQGAVVAIAYSAAVGFAGGFSTLIGIFISLILVALVGGALGLVASALAPSIQAGAALALLLILPQFFFGSAIIPSHDLGPLGQALSAITPARFGFEALVTASGYGKDVARDVCWALPLDQRQALTDDQKQNCTCMGNNIFSKCNFPGVRRAVTSLLDQPQPVQPTPDPAMNQVPVQPVLRQGEALDQYSTEINQYTLELERYQGVVSAYLSELQQYLANATAWEKQQNFAIGDAESRIADEINDYGSIYNVDLGAHWLALIGFSALLSVVFTGIQFRKGRG
jgi:ABC-type multidrug transport system ATPase subunit/energy-converting hydrogenase Eha subunit F